MTKRQSEALEAKKLKAAMKRADRWFGKYIVLKEKKCIICKGEENGQCSHYYGKRACPSLRYDEENAHRMCSACHLRHHKIDNHVYDNWMRHHYSEEELNRLEDIAKQEVLPTMEYYNAIEARYKAMAQALLTKQKQA